MSAHEKVVIAINELHKDKCKKNNFSINITLQYNIRERKNIIIMFTGSQKRMECPGGKLNSGTL